MMKNNLKIGGVMIILIILFFNFNIVATMAQPIGGSSGAPNIGSTSGKPTSIIKLDNPIKVKSLQELLFSLVDLGIFIGSIIALFMFLFIGFKFVMARGNESEIKDAKEWFKWAVIGTAVLLSSKVIVEVMKTTLIDTGLVNEEVFNKLK